MRRPEVLAAAQKQLAEGGWARLEGCPELEADFRAYLGGHGTVWFLSSGTAALEALLIGHGVGPGDEVVTTPYTWGATTAAILAIGALPVFADIEPLSGLIDPASVEQAITPQTKAILVVHLFGQVADMPALKAVATRHNLPLLEDASQAHGARLNGQPVGALADGGAFSCMGMKLLAGTEGGLAWFRDPAVAEAAFLNGRHPRGLSDDRRVALEAKGCLDSLQLGWRPSPVCGALLRAALPFLDQEINARRQNAAWLREALGDNPALTLPEPVSGGDPAWHMLSLVYHPEAHGMPHATFINRSRTLGSGGFTYIETPLHRLPRMNPHTYTGPRVFWQDTIEKAGRRYAEAALPQTDWRCARSVEMGFNWTQLNQKAMQQIAQALNQATDPGFKVNT